jgi:hypothetical protein
MLAQLKPLSQTAISFAQATSMNTVEQETDWNSICATAQPSQAQQRLQAG